MAWNEPPGGNKNDQDPWGNRNRNKNDGPPDLDDLIKQITEKLNKWLGGNKKGGNGGSDTPPAAGFGAIAAIVAVIAVLFTGFNAFYTVDESERAVVLRLGEFYRVEAPGLHYMIPFIDRIADNENVNVTQVREHSLKTSMLTADENIVTVSMTVEYRAADAKLYVLNVRDPESTMAHASESALRHVVGSAGLEQILTTGRDQVQALVKDRLQQYLDNYEVGIQVGQLKITNAAPPTAVQDAFDDVIKAREDQQRLINEAQAYANQIVPVAQGAAQRQLAEAEAYRQEVIARATGESDRFTALLNEYLKAPDITRERLYLDTIEEVYGKSSKVLLDVEGGNNMIYLPLDQLRQSQASGAAATDLKAGAVSSMSQTDVSNLTDQILREIDRRRSNQ
ncbi:FtsH protease activity modulator HflK [Reinekea forsetii]|jgi:membrane protease subunit HflK|uniref:Protein HflK n=1 Tax=Reinekea forsetii TaxID=1336806 RepID=A0A2K8KML5_9GAMM|nr:FtsH protease activity modulator HflK [Reinekea forsetii]ATX76075.1 HflK protein [Reinekea forsetii]